MQFITILLIYLIGCVLCYHTCVKVDTNICQYEGQDVSRYVFSIISWMGCMVGIVLLLKDYG